MPLAQTRVLTQSENYKTDSVLTVMFRIDSECTAFNAEEIDAMIGRLEIAFQIRTSLKMQ